MPDSIELHIKNIQSKLQLLLKKHALLSKENNQLKKENESYQSKEKALIIPRSFLLEDDYVMLENKEKKKVVTGLKDYQKVEILGGLTTADVIMKPAP